MTSRRSFLLAALALAACRSSASSRCAYCGMPLHPGSRWRTAGRAASGSILNFDTPACLFRYASQRGAVAEPAVTEYYAAADQRTDARAVQYAVGSDLIGPMGADLVPVAPEHVATFTADHHPRQVLAYEAVTPAVLDALAGR